MHLPQAYRSLPRPSSLTKPSHPPTGVFAPIILQGFLTSRKVLVVSQHYNTSEVYANYTRKYSHLTSPHNLLLSELLGRVVNTSVATLHVAVD